MALYGSSDGVKRLLRTDPDQVFSADDDARIAAARAVVSALIDAELGRSFSAVADDPYALLVSAGVYPTERILLPRPARSVAAVLVPESWDGSNWTGVEIDPSLWIPDLVSPTGGIAAVRSLTGDWGYRNLLVEAVWYADDPGSVPPAIDYAADYLAMRQFRVELSSATGETGPGGATTFQREGWNETTIRRIFDQYRAAAPAASIVF